MPRFPVPPGETEETWFVKEVQSGLERRYPGGIPAEAQARADREIGVITQMGFPGYFLVTADIINWAKANGIYVGPGRGSATGAIVAYATGITELDPLEHGLLFERFLNPERVSMPDIDIDFDERGRGEAIRYVTEKYGADRVAQIVTYGTIKAKQAVKDSSRILGYPFAMGDRITKAMPAAVMGKDVPLKQIFDSSHKRYGEGGEFRALYEADNDVKTVVDTAIGIEGLKRQWGVHAAGVIMSSQPLLDLIPIMKREADGVDHHPVRLPDLRDPRPAQDGLPRAAQPHRPPGRGAQHRGQHRRDAGAGEAAPRRPADLPAAGQRLHPRRLPARRRPDALAAAAAQARLLRGHRGGARALPARARWAPTATPTTRCARTASSRSPRSTPSWPSRSRRSWRRRTA